MSGAERGTEAPKVVNPKLWQDPDTIRFKDLYKYTSRDMVKISQTLRNLRGSLPYIGKLFLGIELICIGGLLAGCFIFKGIVDGAVTQNIFGKNGIFLMNNHLNFYRKRW